MIPELRRRFMERWSPELYQQLLNNLECALHHRLGFRVSETPVFLPRELLGKMVRYGEELCAQIVENAEYRAASDAIIPERFRVRDEPAWPLFVQADFGLVRGRDGALEPKLVEIQGFPSIYALQCTIARTYAETYELDSGLRYLLGELDEDSFQEVMRRAIVRDHAPEDVALLEVEPESQKTYADFTETQQLLGIRICDIARVKKCGRKLVYEGREIRRIYNRAIADELVRKNVRVDFEFSDDLDVEWAGHPNWFFRLSKFSLPWFRHECVPETWFLDQVSAFPDELHNYVLKPLFSFAGYGVKVGPERADLESIPPEERHNWILQQRMDFVPTLETPAGPTTIEIRIMYVHDRGALRPVTTVIRTGRGKMMGVDYNRNLDWVGASAGFYKED